MVLLAVLVAKEDKSADEGLIWFSLSNDGVCRWVKSKAGKFSPTRVLLCASKKSPLVSLSSVLDTLKGQ